MGEEKNKDRVPIIGTIVHFRNSEGTLYPAICIKINENGTLDLQVFGHNIFLKYDVDHGFENSHWTFVFEELEEKKPIKEDKEAKEDGETNN